MKSFRKEKIKNKTLEPINMLQLYSEGAFPMADETGKIDWYFPETRTVIPIDTFNIPRSLKKILSVTDFVIKKDTCTMQVITNCANRDVTWITDELIEAYQRICDLGFVHSVEVFNDGELVGGLYGIAIRGAFFGESMFSKIPQASKCALAELLNHLKVKKFSVLDVQYITEHLKMFGATEIELNDYYGLLDKAYKDEISFL